MDGDERNENKSKTEVFWLDIKKQWKGGKLQCIKILYGEKDKREDTIENICTSLICIWN